MSVQEIDNSDNAEFKVTEIGLIPQDWKIGKLGDFVSVQTGYNFKSDFFGEQSSDESIPLIRIRDLIKNKTKTYYTGTLDSEIVRDFSVNNGDILIGMDGNFHVIEWFGGTALLNQRVARLQDFTAEVDRKYIYYIIINPVKKIEEGKHFTTVKHLSNKDLINIRIPLPPRPEQKAIAHILSTVQRAKEATEQVIQATKELKKSLMKHLFTYGAVSLEEAPNVNLKETEIGMMPENWEVNCLETVTKVVVGHVGPISKFYSNSENGVPLFSTTNITDNGVDMGNLKFVTYQFYDEHKKSQLESDDIIIARHGKSGSSAVIPKSVIKSSALNVVIIKKSPLFDSYFLNTLLNSTNRLAEMNNLKSGSVQGVVNTSLMKKMLIPIPKQDVQNQISMMLRAVDSKIDSYNDRKKILDQLFKSLLNNLMTGKIRIKNFENIV